MNFGQTPEVPYYEYTMKMNDVWINMPKASYEANIYINHIAKQLYVTEKDSTKFGLILKVALLKLVSSGILVDRSEIVLDVNRMFELNLIQSKIK